MQFELIRVLLCGFKFKTFVISESVKFEFNNFGFDFVIDMLVITFLLKTFTFLVKPTFAFGCRGVKKVILKGRRQGLK